LGIGTPALATRGFGPEDFHEVADVIATALHPGFDDAVGADLRGRVAKLADRHPLYVRRWPSWTGGSGPVDRAVLARYISDVVTVGMRRPDEVRQ
jgi:hypothetical protein